MIRAASHLAPRRSSQGLYKTEGFYREKGGARELLAKEKEGIFLVQDIIWGEGNSKGFIMQIASSSSGGGEGPRGRLPPW